VAIPNSLSINLIYMYYTSWYEKRANFQYFYSVIFAFTLNKVGNGKNALSLLLVVSSA
jgi:hypothetical protein